MMSDLLHKYLKAKNLEKLELVLNNPKLIKLALIDEELMSFTFSRSEVIYFCYDHDEEKILYPEVADRIEYQDNFEYKAEDIIIQEIAYLNDKEWGKKWDWEI